MLRCSTTGIVPCKIRGRARMAPASYCHFVCSVPGDPLCWNGMPFRGGMMPILEENDWLKRKNRSVLRTDRVMTGGPATERPTRSRKSCHWDRNVITDLTSPGVIKKATKSKWDNS